LMLLAIKHEVIAEELARLRGQEPC
jgi:hypothetical protein